jgi:hypothetical protein
MDKLENNIRRFATIVGDGILHSAVLISKLFDLVPRLNFANIVRYTFIIVSMVKISMSPPIQYLMSPEWRDYVIYIDDIFSGMYCDFRDISSNLSQAQDFISDQRKLIIKYEDNIKFYSDLISDKDALITKLNCDIRQLSIDKEVLLAKSEIAIAARRNDSLWAIAGTGIFHTTLFGLNQMARYYSTSPVDLRDLTMMSKSILAILGGLQNKASSGPITTNVTPSVIADLASRVMSKCEW